MSHFSKPCLDILQIIKISPAQNLQVSFSFDLIEFKTLTLQAPTVGQSFNEKNINWPFKCQFHKNTLKKFVGFCRQIV